MDELFSLKQDSVTLVQLAWGPEPLEGQVKYLISIGSGVPSLKQEDIVPKYADLFIEQLKTSEGEAVQSDLDSTI